MIKRHYDNSSEALKTIDGLDYSGDKVYVKHKELNDRVLKEAPLVGKYFANKPFSAQFLLRQK